MTGGLFIVVEGGDGVGKTTQLERLAEWLDELGIDHLLTREPGGTPVGEAIRSVVLSRDELDMPAESELLLYLAARAAFVRDVVRPALASGRTVLTDRYSLSTMAYQGYGRGIDRARIREGLVLATGGLEPDVYLLFDLPEEEARARQERSAETPDRIEREGPAFRRAVRDGYLELAASDTTVEVIDARGSAEEVHRRVRSRLTARFPDTFPGDSDAGDGIVGEGT